MLTGKLGATAHPPTLLLSPGANNYLGLSSHPAVIEAAHKALDTHGFGLSSVRFICGTQVSASVMLLVIWNSIRVVVVCALWLCVYFAYSTWPHGVTTHLHTNTPTHPHRTFTSSLSKRSVSFIAQMTLYCMPVALMPMQGCLSPFSLQMML